MQMMFCTWIQHEILNLGFGYNYSSFTFKHELWTSTDVTFSDLELWNVNLGSVTWRGDLTNDPYSLCRDCAKRS